MKVRSLFVTCISKRILQITYIVQITTAVTYSLNYHCDILGFVQLHALRRILVGMCNTFPTTRAAHPFAFLNATRSVCQLKDTCAGDVIVGCFDAFHDFRQVCRSKALLRIHRQKGGLQVLWRIVAVRAPIFRWTRR